MDKIKVFLKKVYKDFISFVSHTLKNRFALLATLFFIFLFAFSNYQNNIEIDRLADSYKTTLMQKDTEFQKVVNTLTKEVSYQQKVLEYERGVTRRMQDESIKKITEELRLEAKNLKNIIKLKFDVKGTGSTDLVKVDTIYIDSVGNRISNYNFDWTDGYLNALVNVNEKIGTLTYTYSDSIRLVGFVKKRGFLGLGKPDYMIDVKFGNQNTNMKGMQSVSFDKAVRNRYSIGVGVGYYYIPTINKFTPGIGVSIQRNLINIK